jgi:hypothetical protein
MDSYFPIKHDGKDRVPWQGHAFIHVEFVYSIVQQASTNPDLTPAQELDTVPKPTWAQGSLADTDSLDLVLPSDEAIIEAMNSLDRP